MSTSTATENVVEELSDFIGLLGDVPIDQFTSCGVAIHASDCAGTRREADVVASAQRAAVDSAPDDDSEEDGDDEKEAPSQTPPVPLTSQRAAEHLRALRDFGLFKNQPQFTASNCQAEEFLKLNNAKKLTALNRQP